MFNSLFFIILLCIIIFSLYQTQFWFSDPRVEKLCWETFNGLLEYSKNRDTHIHDKLKQCLGKLKIHTTPGKFNGKTSYTLNKKDIYICVESKSYNTIIYVFIHELAHVINDSIGHTHEFKVYFRRLLELANSSGIYTKIDYFKEPEMYCGMKLNSQILS